MCEQELLRVVGQRRDPVGVANQPAGEPAAPRAVGELEDLRTVEGQDESLRPEGPKKLEQHHREHRTGFRQVDHRVPQPAAFANQLAAQQELAAPVVGALDRQPAQPERPALFGGFLAGSLGPNFEVVTQRRGGLGDFFCERGDAAAGRVELVRDQENGRGGGGGRITHAQEEAATGSKLKKGTP